MPEVQRPWPLSRQISRGFRNPRNALLLLLKWERRKWMLVMLQVGVCC
ncbi:hypothetical protein N9L68_05935 [bacterium]|nr:hypothetical protein [bacterium]